VELKSNHLCTARAAHLGRTTQVWDAVVTHRETGKTLALFRCTQMLLAAPEGKPEAPSAR
jgi:acyl-coenzyme A thioesterase PaaI-like protein